MGTTKSLHRLGMNINELLLLLVETILGAAAFYGLLSTGWGGGEQLFLGAAFLAILFAIEERGLYSDKQHEQVVELLVGGFATDKETVTDQIISVLKRYRFESEWGLLVFSTLTVLARYVVWFVLGWAVHKYGVH